MPTAKEIPPFAQTRTILRRKRADREGVHAARHRLTATRACALLAGGLAVFFILGCAGRPAPAAPPAPARLTIANATDYSWRLVLAAKAPRGSVRETIVAPREVVVLELPAGAYAVEQGIAGAEAAAARRFGVEFAAGENYEWPLATVRSVAGAP